jgi:hypothetical protein
MRHQPLNSITDAEWMQEPPRTVGSGRLDNVGIPFYTVSMMYGAYNFQGFYTMTRIRQV